MIGPYSATAIILVFLLVFGLVLPIIGVIPKVRDIVSLRYLTLVVWLACMIGVVVNYHDLDSSIKRAVVIGTAILSGIYIILRSIEKWLFNGWKFSKDIEASLSKGDAKAEIKVKNSETKEGSDKNDRPE